MAWETVLASVDITIGGHVYHAGIIRRGETPHQTYHIRKGTAYQEFDGKGNDNAATVLGLTKIALMLGQELDEYGQVKGPPQEQV